MNTFSIIGCIVGVTSCIVGVASFVSAQITKAKQDGMVLAKIEQCVKNTEDIKKEMKEKNKEYDNIIDSHTQSITRLRTEMQMVLKNLKLEKDF